MVAATKSLCGAKTKQGGQPCRRPAGWGTPHLGRGRCKMHLGNTQRHLLAAVREEIATMAEPFDIDPHGFLLHLVQAAAGRYLCITQMLGALKEDELLAEGQLHALAQAHAEAIELGAKIAKTAIDAGVEERRVRNAERAGDLLAALAEAMFEALGTAPKDRARVLPIVEGRLLQLEQRSGEAA